MTNDDPDIIVEVGALLTRTLRQLLTRRLDDGAFRDEADVRQRSYFSTLEGLDALLIPFVNLPKNWFWRPLLDEFPTLIAVLTDDVNFLLSHNYDSRQPLDEQGEPYFRGGPPGRETPYWTSECSSFTLSVLTNFLNLRQKYGLRKSPPDKDIHNAVQLHLSWLENCKRNNNGWARTFDSPAHPWPTWSLLDTFEEMLYSKHLRRYHKRLEEQCEGVVSHLRRQLGSTASKSLGGRWKSLLESTTHGGAYNVGDVLDIGRLMLSVALHSKPSQVLPIAERLYQWASRTDYGRRRYRYHLEEKGLVYDSSLVPSVLRALVVMADRLRSRSIEQLNAAIEGNHEFAIQRAYDACNESLIDTGAYEGLWGVREGERLVYELYYTERMIEALTEFLLHFRHADVSNLQPKLGPVTRVPEVSVPAREQVRGGSPPSDVERYTAWIRELARGRRPPGLRDIKEWPEWKLLEFYVYRLFTVALMLEGKEYGRKKAFEPFPDGVLYLPDHEPQCIYDTKSTKGSFDLPREEFRKFKEYAQDAKRLADAAGREARFMLVIAPEFGGEWEGKVAEFEGEVGLRLVFATADELCDFADRVRERTTRVRALRLIKWSKLLAKGRPVIEARHYDEIFKEWQEDLGRMTMD